MENIFFDSWPSLVRSFTITILAYFTMVIMLRVTGKRALSKMNAFDFIVTVALGSSLATVALNKNVALLDGALVFFLLLFLQYLITFLSVRVKLVKKIVTSSPSLLLYKGEILSDQLISERITLEEIHVAARKKGISSLKEVDAIILETTGDLTIISDIHPAQAPTMEEVKNVPRNNS